ncbi:MAG TPA: rhodanese-related sulfurtransferase [Acidobacteriota bacterium]|nr:rhodanese-related sulfurtransferase [Acidobacteriota bacterium]
MKVLLFYKFVKIKDPQKLCDEMKVFCKARNLLGRILLADMGINGTCAGADEDIAAYKKYMHEKKEFKDIWFKEQSIEQQPFPRMSIRVRPELVTLRIPDLHPSAGGKHLEPSQVHDLINKFGKDVVFLDTRNEIESRIGKFKDAVTPNIKTFRDLPAALPALENLKDKHVVTYCTGGIRCEVATALLKKEGFKNVYQINGGIYNYCQQYPNGLFEGTCFVFDDRMQIGWGNDAAVKLEEEMPTDKIISSCEFCGKKTARVVNDERVLDRVLRVCCKECDKKLDLSRLRTPQERETLFASAKQKSTEHTLN